uniref:Protein CutA n=1 Tax=Equus asinus TaxID=9793 RepID=A0A8C4MTX7_EQUAS
MLAVGPPLHRHGDCASQQFVAAGLAPPVPDQKGVYLGDAGVCQTSLAQADPPLSLPHQGRMNLPFHPACPPSAPPHSLSVSGPSVSLSHPNPSHNTRWVKTGGTPQIFGTTFLPQHWTWPSKTPLAKEAGQAGPREGRDWLALEARGSPVSTVTWCALFSYHVAAAQAALLLSLLWMPVLQPGASRLLLLPRALLSMASGSPPSQPSQASGSGYVPGSVSAAFVTCPNEKVAKEIARAVVEKHLAACVNLIPKITSIYEWKGKIEEDSEVLMMIKTQSSLVPALTDFVRSVHPYEVAEVIALPVEQGNIPYLNWVRQVTVISDSSTVQP